MRKRILRYIKYLVNKYIPGTSKLAVMEAKRLSEHIFDNFDAGQQLIILEEVKLNLIEMRQNQIKDKEIEIIKSNDDLKLLELNLEKLTAK